MVAKANKDTRPKRTKSKTVAAPAPESSAPTAETLALIAANVAKGVDLEPRLAVDYAFKLWKSAREKLEGEIKEPAPVPQETRIQKSDGGDPLPAFPATFDTFLGMVVNGKTLADSTNRFRDFLRHNSVAEVEADKRLAKFADEGFKDPASWQITALEYRDWWKSRDSSLAGKPVEPSVLPPKTALPAFDTFLRTVVKGETDADSKKRFHTFLCSKFPEPEADERLARLSQEGFKDVGSWLETTRDYRDWCKSEKFN